MMKQISVKPTKLGFTNKGVKITAISKGGQAESLGVKVGWKVQAVAGKAVATSEELTAALSSYKKKGKNFSIKFLVPPSSSAPLAKKLGSASIPNQANEKEEGPSPEEVELHKRKKAEAKKKADEEATRKAALMERAKKEAEAKAKAQKEAKELEERLSKMKPRERRKEEARIKKEAFAKKKAELAAKEEAAKNAIIAQYGGVGGAKGGGAAEGEGGGFVGKRQEGCSCKYGNPCVDKYICKDWNNRFAIARKNGWKLG